VLGTLFGALPVIMVNGLVDFFEWFYNGLYFIPYILLILAFAAVFSSSLCLLSSRYTDGLMILHSLVDGYLSFHSC